MTKYNWDVSDDEKNRILNLHESATKNLYLLTEQNQQPFTVDFGNTFKSGAYEFTPNYESVVNNKVVEIVNYIKNKQLKSFKLVITPGESQVPNQINTATGRRFGVGELAEKRADVLKQYLTKVLTSSLSFTPQIEVTKSVIGKTPPGGNRNDPKYTAEQFVRVSVVITAGADPQPQPYKRTADFGESIFMNQVLVGYADTRTVNTKSISDPGIQNTARQDIIFTEVKKDTQPPVVLGRYNVPFQWWNKRTTGTTNTITPEELAHIKMNFPKISSSS